MLDEESMRMLALIAEERRREKLGMRVTDLVGALPKGLAGIILEDPLPVPHLSPILDPLEAALRRMRDVWFCGSAAVQHAKTSSLQVALGQGIARDPTLRLAYVTYTADRGIDRSKQIRDVATYLGVSLRSDVQSGALWRTTSGGFLQAAGVDGGLVGLSYDVVVIDDPYKSRKDAESPVYRADVEAMVRTIADRARSIFLIHARWHPDDAVGSFSKLPKWQFVNLPAVAEVGVPDALGREPGQLLWPAHPRKGLDEYFDPFRAYTYDWYSLYQGMPRPRGGKVYQAEASTYDRADLPKTPLVYAVGYDLAGTARTQADFAVFVAMALEPVSGTYYVLDVLRMQGSAPDVRRALTAFCAPYPGAQRFSFVGGQEQSVVDLMNEPGRDGTPGAQLTTASASGRGDKFVRAQPSAADWNAGKILIPRGAHPHMQMFVQVVKDFTGVADRVDDDVDALSSVHEVLRHSVGQVSAELPRVRVWRR